MTTNPNRTRGPSGNGRSTTTTTTGNSGVVSTTSGGRNRGLVPPSSRRPSPPPRTGTAAPQYAPRGHPGPRGPPPAVISRSGYNQSALSSDQFKKQVLIPREQSAPQPPPPVPPPPAPMPSRGLPIPDGMAQPLMGPPSPTRPMCMPNSCSVPGALNGGVLPPPMMAGPTHMMVQPQQLCPQPMVAPCCPQPQPQPVAVPCCPQPQPVPQCCPQPAPAPCATAGVELLSNLVAPPAAMVRPQRSLTPPPPAPLPANALRNLQQQQQQQQQQMQPVQMVRIHDPTQQLVHPQQVVEVVDPAVMEARRVLDEIPPPQPRGLPPSPSFHPPSPTASQQGSPIVIREVNTDVMSTGGSLPAGMANLSGGPQGVILVEEEPRSEDPLAFLKCDMPDTLHLLARQCCLPEPKSSENEFENIEAHKEHHKRLKTEHESIRQARDLEYLRTYKELEEMKLKSELDIGKMVREIKEREAAIDRLQRKERQALESMDKLRNERECERIEEQRTANQIDVRLTSLDDASERIRQCELGSIRRRLREQTEIQSALNNEKMRISRQRQELRCKSQGAEVALQRRVEELKCKEAMLERQWTEIQDRRQALEKENQAPAPHSPLRPGLTGSAGPRSMSQDRQAHMVRSRTPSPQTYRPLSLNGGDHQGSPRAAKSKVYHRTVTREPGSNVEQSISGEDSVRIESQSIVNQDGSGHHVEYTCHSHSRSNSPTQRPSASASSGAYGSTPMSDLPLGYRGSSPTRGYQGGHNLAALQQMANPPPAALGGDDGYYANRI